MSGSSETLGQEIVIVPCVAKEGEDDARSVSVMHHLWNITTRATRGFDGKNLGSRKPNLKVRFDLTVVIREVVDSWKTTQADAAERLGVTQPRLNDLLRGRIDKFSIDALMELASRAGLQVRVELNAAPLTVASPELGAPTVGQDRHRQMITVLKMTPPILLLVEAEVLNDESLLYFASTLEAEEA